MATPTKFRHFRAALVEYVPTAFFRRFVGPAEMRWVVEQSDDMGRWQPLADMADDGSRFDLEGATAYASGLEAARIVLLSSEEREEQGISTEEHGAALSEVLQ